MLRFSPGLGIRYHSYDVAMILEYGLLSANVYADIYKYGLT